MGDIKDILGLSRNSSVAPRAPKLVVKKPEGMSREVFALLSHDATAAGGSPVLSLVPTPKVSEGFKEKRSVIIGWEWRKFTNSARSDGLELGHWVKRNDNAIDYSFARFNKKVKVLRFTDAEYDAHLVSTVWSKEQTSLLFDLCQQFDLRWPIIHDRFTVNEQMTIEDLKQRFYKVCSTLLAARSAQPDADVEYSEHPLAKFKYDVKHEKERKAEYERLYNRSAAEARQEIAQLEQAKALEAKLKAQKKLQKPGGRAAGLAALRASFTANGLGGSEELCSQLALAGLPGLAGLMDAPRKHRNAEVWLRSKDISVKRPASDKLASAFEQRLADFGLEQPLHPSEPIVSLYHQNRAHIVLLVELEAKLNKLEYEKNLLLSRGKQQSHSVAPGAEKPTAGQRKRPLQDGSVAAAKRSHH